MNATPPLDPASAQLVAMEHDIQAGRIDAAIAALKRFHAANPTDPRALLIDALICRARNDTQRELIALHRLTTAAPRWARAFMETATTLSREGRHPEALTAVEAAVDLAPGERPPLQVAIALCNAAGHAQQALVYLEKAHALWPDDVEIQRQLGSVLTNLHRYEQAESLWRSILVRNPGDIVAHSNFAITLVGMQRRDEAVAQLETALQLEPDNETLRFLLAGARGETPPRQPDSYVQGLFDGYASHFDNHLVGTLKYGVPRRIAQMLNARDGENASNDILDLGCGTGLVGVYLGAHRGSLVGVDLSPRMLEQARKHPIYTRLEQANLADALAAAAPASFDYIVAADVFIYVGALDAIIAACHRVLRPGGALLFSCEAAGDEEGALVLRPSNRYANSRASIRSLCEQAGFARCTLEDIDVRMENNQAIPGFIALAEK